MFRLFSPILVVASRVDSSTRVSWMLLNAQKRLRRRAPIVGVESRQQGTQFNFYRTPLQHAQSGGERSLAGRVSSRSKVRNVQPPSYEPEYPLLISRKPNHRTVITEYNESCKLRATPKSMKHHSTLAWSLVCPLIVSDHSLTLILCA